MLRAEMKQIVHATLRGVIGATAMTGARDAVVVLNEMRERTRE